MRTLESLAALLLYGALHSLTAAGSWKAWVAARVGERAFHGLYRLSYSIVSVLALLPVLSWLGARPGRTVWSAAGVTADVLWAVRLVAIVGLALSLLQIDVFRFLGIRDAIAYVRGRPLPLPPERLVTRGVYRLVRHPLYLFGAIALWTSPVMTEALLGFTLGVTIYVMAGSILEERRMARDFGPEYVAYRTTVPWLIPFARRGR
jgi:protein-S-isoprenylcysteine O-methyltransferase Ste14